MFYRIYWSSKQIHSKEDEEDKKFLSPTFTHLHQFLAYLPMRLTSAPCSCDSSSLIFMPGRGIKLGLTFKKFLQDGIVEALEELAG